MTDKRSATHQTYLSNEKFCGGEQSNLLTFAFLIDVLSNGQELAVQV